VKHKKESWIFELELKEEETESSTVKEVKK